MCLYTQIKLLYDNKLYSNITTLGNLMLNIMAHQPDAIFGPSAKYQTMVYVAQSFHFQQDYKRADVMYKKALQYYKAVMKTKTLKTAEIFKDFASETDVKCAIAECNILLRQYSQALAILESVSLRNRTPKINMMLGQLYKQAGMERPAIVAYKEVLKECPLAFDAVLELLSLGVPGAEVASLMINVPNSSCFMEWLTLLVKGQAYLHHRDYSNAIAAFKQLEENSPLMRNPQILNMLGEAYYIAGDSRNALCTLQKAHALDPLSLRGIDLLACLYANEKRIRDLENLAMDATSVTDSAPEPWIAMGYYCHVAKHRSTKAIHFAHKACSINPRSVEGLLLKGMLLLELKKLQEAIMHFREAMQIAPHRFEPHKGLVDCYLSMQRTKEAVTIASNACKLMGQTSRTLTLYASVLLKDPLTMSKGKTLLEKALKEDAYYLPAVYLLCEIYVQDTRYDAAIELLKKQVTVQSTWRLHQMLADFHNHIQDEEKAAHHFSIALNLSQEPSSTRSLEALPKIEASSENSSVPACEMEVEDIGESEGEIEESDLEAVWSDVDFSFTGH